MGKRESVRALLAGWPGEDPNPSIQEVLTNTPKVDDAADEIQIAAALPGDDEHPLSSEPNPYLFRPFSELKQMLLAGMEPDEERLVRAAINYQRIAHTGHLHGFRARHEAEKPAAEEPDMFDFLEPL